MPFSERLENRVFNLANLGLGLISLGISLFTLYLVIPSKVNYTQKTVSTQRSAYTPQRNITNPDPGDIWDHRNAASQYLKRTGEF